MIKNYSNKIERAFTLIELLVVISIIAILMSIMMPALSRARAMAQSVSCRSQLRDIGLGFNMYVQDNSGHVVQTSGSTQYFGGRWMMSLSKYMYNRRVNSADDPQGAASEGGIYDFQLFRCPVEAVKIKKAGLNPDGTIANGSWGNYGYNQFFTGYPANTNFNRTPNNTREANAWRKFDSIITPSTLPLFADTNTDDPVNIGDKGMWWLSAKGPHPNAYFNHNWNGGAARISQTSSQWAPRGAAPNHNGKTNYLMADGHVETTDIWPWSDHKGTDFHPKRNVDINPPAPPADYFRF